MYFVSYSSLSIYIRGRLNKNKKLEKEQRRSNQFCMASIPISLLNVR